MLCDFLTSYSYAVQHIGIVVVRPSVGPILDVLWLIVKTYGKTFTLVISSVLNLDMQNFSDLVQGEQQHENYVIHTRLIHTLASTLF